MVRRLDPEISIGALARRTGLAASAIRYYEDIGLVAAQRTASGARRFRRSDIRRLSLVRILQQFGFTLSRIGDELRRLPSTRAPDSEDWQSIAAGLRDDIDQRIATLERLRDNLDGCIGCGCLSLKNCALFNAGDRAANHGPGARYLMGDRPDASS